MLGLISARDTTCMSRTSQYFYKKKRCQVHRENEATTRHGLQHSVPASGVLRTPHADTKKGKVLAYITQSRTCFLWISLPLSTLLLSTLLPTLLSTLLSTLTPRHRCRHCYHCRHCCRGHSCRSSIRCCCCGCGARFR